MKLVQDAFSAADAAPTPPAGPLDGAPFDDVDRGVLHALQLDGRRPFRDIARELGVAEATIRSRVKRLRDSGVLRVIGFIDPSALGYGVLASVLVRVLPAHHEETAETLASWPEAMYVSSCVGGADLYVQVLCENQTQLYDLISKRMSCLHGIISTEVLVEIKVHKAEYIAPGLA